MVPQDRLYQLPNGADPVETVALLHAADTAYLGLFREARLRYGETVVVSGGGGAAGTSAVQLASACGAHVIATAREGGRRLVPLRRCGDCMEFHFVGEKLCQTS